MVTCIIYVTPQLEISPTFLTCCDKLAKVGTFHTCPIILAKKMAAATITWLGPRLTSLTVDLKGPRLEVPGREVSNPGETTHEVK
jgi:hypothetical protein